MTQEIDGIIQFLMKQASNYQNEVAKYGRFPYSKFAFSQTAKQAAQNNYDMTMKAISYYSQLLQTYKQQEASKLP